MFSYIRVSFVAACVLLSVTLKAQQEPAYSQYMFNPLVYNPAVSGTNENYSGVLQSRFQWVGFDDAPRTNVFSIHSPAPIYEDMVGLGLTFVNDSWGPIRHNNVFLSYSYRTMVHDGAWVSFGLSSGVESRRLDFAGLNPLNPGDPSYAEDDMSHTTMNFGTGVYYYTDTYYLGLSIPKLRRVVYNRDFTSAPYEQNTRHIFLSGGYKHVLDQDWTLKPSFLTRLVAGTPFSMDVSFSAVYQDMMLAGLSYRLSESLGLMFHIKAFEFMWFGYAYEYGLGTLSSHHSGSHEIMLIFDLDL